jgi:hypothetical protein
VVAARWHGVGAVELSERGDTDGDVAAELRERGCTELLERHCGVDVALERSGVERK